MKICDDIRVNSLAGLKIVHRNDLSGVGRTSIISLSKTAEWLLEAMRGREFDESDAVKALMDHYDVDEQVAARDVSAWVEQLKKGGILE